MNQITVQRNSTVSNKIPPTDLGNDVIVRVRCIDDVLATVRLHHEAAGVRHVGTLAKRGAQPVLVAPHTTTIQLENPLYFHVQEKNVNIFSVAFITIYQLRSQS